MESGNIAVNTLNSLIGGISVQAQKNAQLLKMSNDQIKQDGQNVMQLLQATPQTAQGGSSGHQIDVMA